MVYNANIPQPSDDLSDSQGQILGNFAQANTSFGIDHYAFNNLTSNNGKHNQITTPAYVATPPTGLPPVTIANEPKMYAFQVTAPLGVLNYSRGPSDAVPTPLTSLHSPVTAVVLAPSPGGSIPIFDFAGLTLATCEFFVVNNTNDALRRSAIFTISWNGTAISASVDGSLTTNLGVAISGTTMFLTNSSASTFSNIFWTLKFFRVQT